MSGHTPGPWHVPKENYLLVEAPSGNVALCNLARNNYSDARLIAAAPDLLAALKRVEWSGCDGSTRLFCPECQRHADGKRHEDDCDLGLTIAKAEGR